MRRIVRHLSPLMVLGIVSLTACEDDEPTGPGNGGNGNPPAAATNVTATANGTGIEVTWTPPASNVTDQRVELENPTGSDGLREQDVAGDATSATFSGLTEGETYTATVVTINSNGETRSSSASATIGTSVPAFEDVFGVVGEDVTWTNDRKWVLNGAVSVGTDCGPDPASPLPGCNAVTLTIEPGTTILGNINAPAGQRSSYLIVARGSQIIADANANEADPYVRPASENVIVFTSSAPRGQRDRGDWGGLVLNGRAPINTGSEATGEGESGLFGGVDDNDSSGILRGVRVAFAGDDVTATDQLNGIALQGTGAGTTVDYVQVHYNVDDGTEPFGGSTSQTHVIMTGIGDDSFDGTDGYRGFIQYGIAQQRGDDADNGMELSNNGDTPAADMPSTTAVVANVTIIGPRSGGIAGASGDIGLNLREGSHWRIYNSIVVGMNDSGLCVEGAEAAANADAAVGGSTVPNEITTVNSTILWDNVSDGAGADNFADACGSGYENQSFFETAGFNNLAVDPLLTAAAFDVGMQSMPPDFVPTGIPAGYTPTDVSTFNNEGGTGIIPPTDGRALEATNYAGAVEPGTAAMDAWYYGWTQFDPAGLDDRTNQDDQ